MKIYTTNFKNLEKLDDKKLNLVPISISNRKLPNWEGIYYKKLAPKSTMLLEYLTRGGSLEEYIDRYKTEVLSKLDRSKVLDELKQLSQEKDIVLVYYEDNPSFNHSCLIASWLNEIRKSTKIKVTELKLEKPKYMTK